MRFAFVLLVIGQLLARGVMELHCHLSHGQPGPDDRPNRAHLHLVGHSHPHPHPHSHDHHGLANVPVKSIPVAPSPNSSDHDQGAVYFSGETLTAEVHRVQISDLTFTGWFAPIASLAAIPTISSDIWCRAAGPPREHSGPLHNFMPHVLRV